MMHWKISSATLVTVTIALLGRFCWNVLLPLTGELDLTARFLNALKFGIKDRITLRSTDQNERHQQDFWVTLPEDFRPEKHNSTVDGRPIPGPFWDNKLLLLGARLTTSYEDDDQSVHATLFGMGGLWHREKAGQVRCETNEFNGENGTLWTFQRIVEETNVLVTFGDERPDSLSSMISMERILTISVDPHVDHTTLIWSADLSRILTKEDLQQQVSKSANKAVRLQFWIQEKAKKSGAISMVWPLSVVDIPLSTGVVGHAGPQIRRSTTPSGSRSINEITDSKHEDQAHNDAPRVHPAAQSRSALVQPPVDAALCVAIYGRRSLKHLPEFLTHHTNVGFDQIIVGVIDTLMDGEMIHKAQDKLQDFIDDGTVSLAVAGLPLLDCEVDTRKTHFYTSCLYHAKGVAEYVGVWDLDEYWVPPKLPHGKSFGRDHELRPRSPLKTSDEIWRQSPYPDFPNIGQVMKYVNAYHEQAGCSELWCFHTMPSTFVYRRRDGTGDVIGDRAGIIHKDFELRSVQLDQEYSKSVARTKFVNLGGIHQPGSCRFSPTGKYMSRRGTPSKPRGYSTNLRVDDDETCKNLRLDTEEYGAMHHFYSLNRPRDDGRYICDGEGAGCKEDEYIQVFGQIVEQQLIVKNVIASVRNDVQFAPRN